jgi:hypothetical protein
MISFVSHSPPPMVVSDWMMSALSLASGWRKHDQRNSRPIRVL